MWSSGGKDRSWNIHLRSSACSRPPSHLRCPRPTRLPPPRSHRCWEAVSSPGGAKNKSGGVIAAPLIESSLIYQIYLLRSICVCTLLLLLEDSSLSGDL